MCSSKRKFTIYYHHGWFTGRRPGSKVNNAELMALYNDCDVSVTGHCHTRVSSGPIDYSTYNGPKLKYGLVCGSFTKGVDFDKISYPEERGFNPQRYGMGSWAINVMPFPSNDDPLMFTAEEFNLKWNSLMDRSLSCQKK